MLDSRLGMVICQFLSNLNFPSKTRWLSGKFESLAIILKPCHGQKEENHCWVLSSFALLKETHIIKKIMKESELKLLKKSWIKISFRAKSNLESEPGSEVKGKVRFCRIQNQ